MITTLNAIRAHQPCADGWQRLLTYLGKTRADDEPLRISTVLNANGLSDALWCLRAVEGCDREIRLYTVWCARQVQHLMRDPRSLAVLDVAERHATGQATDEELTQAREEAEEAEAAAGSRETAWAARAAAWTAGTTPAAAEAAVVARETAWAAAWAAEAAWDAAAWAAAWATREAAWEKARDAQARKLREVCEEWEARRSDAPQA